MSTLISPFFPAKNTAEWHAAAALVATRTVFVAEPRPPMPICEAFRAARSAMKAWLYWHGCPIVAAGRMWFIDDQDALDDIPQPQAPKMPTGTKAADGGSGDEPKPEEDPLPVYRQPRGTPGDFAACAVLVSGRPVWSFKVAAEVLGYTRTTQQLQNLILDAHAKGIDTELALPAMKVRVNDGNWANTQRMLTVTALRLLRDRIERNRTGPIDAYLKSIGG